MKNYEISFTAEWSGDGSSICHGNWSLYAEFETEEAYEEKSMVIPSEMVSSHMNTYGTYVKVDMDENCKVVTNEYQDGLSLEYWININKSWLAESLSKVGLEASMDYIKEIYVAFQEKDWRKGSCGGCV